MHLIEPGGIGVYGHKSWDGDEGILPQFNPQFNLTDDRMARLSAKFLEFQTDRRTIHALLGDYAADYRRFKGSELARQEYLRERYASRAPQLSHLVWDDEDGLYWGPADIAILLNRDRSAVSRTLAKMAADEEWHIRLSVLRRNFGRSASTPIYAYRQEIFDLIVDYYEEDYLRRFIRPRRGRPRNEEEAREVRRYWNHLKDAARAAPERFWEESDPAGLPDIPPMGFKEALRLILSKVLSLRTGALFTVLFALGYELSRRWPALFLWLPAVAVLVFFACIPLLRRGKFNPAHVASLGAGALLFCLLWTVGLLSREGTTHTPGGVLRVRDTERKANLTLNPRIWNDGIVRFTIDTDADVRKILRYSYRISPDVEYRTTGFMRETNPTTGAKYPDMTINTGRSEGIVELDVKYLGADGSEHGPYPFRFDLDAVRFENGKDWALHSVDEWLSVYRLEDPQRESEGTTFVMVDPGLFSDEALDAVLGIVYGIDTRTPDTKITMEELLELKKRGVHELLTSREDVVTYASARLLFRDGTSSDVRVFEKTIR